MWALAWQCITYRGQLLISMRGDPRPPNQASPRETARSHCKRCCAKDACHRSACNGAGPGGPDQGAARFGGLQEPQPLQPEERLPGDRPQHWNGPIWTLVRSRFIAGLTSTSQPSTRPCQPIPIPLAHMFKCSEWFQDTGALTAPAWRDFRHQWPLAPCAGRA